MIEEHEAQEVMRFYFTAVRVLMNAKSNCELSASFYLGMGCAQAAEYRKRYKEENEKSNFFLAVETECNDLYRLLLERGEQDAV